MENFGTRKGEKRCGEREKERESEQNRTEKKHKTSFIPSLFIALMTDNMF